MGNVEVRPLTAAIGAEIHGVDLRQPLDPADLDQVNAALRDHLAVFFRDQPLAPEELIAFGRQLGALEIHPFAPSHPDHREIVHLDQVNPVGEGADNWHADATFQPKPPGAAVLQAIVVPPVGGDTCFANMQAAFEALSAPVQELLENLRGVNDLSMTLASAIEHEYSSDDLREMQKSWPPVEHPVVRSHPVTGRKAIFVNGNFTVRLAGLTIAESERLLGFLFAHVRSPRFQCRFRWEVHSIAVWDNRCVQHFGVPDYLERRVMHRLNLAGEAPV
ncbi:MAG: TauD/TfdA family dioxygenase [Myxococcales bacterium]|nr:TauD/TfdA family dioxygenase [Myxococcales bacterium]